MTAPTEEDALELHHTDGPVARYVWRLDDLPRHVAPRPFLHPVRTLDGVPVTEFMPADHPHHLGASIAVPDLGGGNFWGGRTFVRAHGPTMLENHGSQQHRGWVSRSPEAAAADLSWTAADGTVLLHERRRIAVVPLPGCWALDVSFALTNVTAEPLSFASPATNGRPGAGYGGFFWRAPYATAGAMAFGPRGRGVRHLHGRHGAWLALTGAGRPGGRWTLIFVPGDEASRSDPWFVRTDGYPGVGSCLAWDRPLVVPAGCEVRRRIITVVADGAVAADRADHLAATVAAHVGGG